MMLIIKLDCFWLLLSRVKIHIWLEQFLYTKLWKATNIAVYSEVKCLLHSQDEAEDKITFDYALKLNRTIKIIGFIHQFNKYLRCKECYQHINMVCLLQWYAFCKKQAFFTVWCYARHKYIIHSMRSCALPPGFWVSFLHLSLAI